MSSLLRAVFLWMGLSLVVWLAGCAGETTPSATPVDDVGVESGADTAVAVDARTLTALVISPATGFVSCRPLALRATATWSDGASEEVTSSAKWSSSDDSIVRISPGFASPADKNGTVTITATYLTLTATASIGRTPCAEKLDVSPVSASAPVGRTLAFTATWTSEDGVKLDVTKTAIWKSSDEIVATIDGTTGFVKLLKKGSVLLTAAYGGHAATASLVVEDTSLEHIHVLPLSATGTVGGPNVAFTAQAHYTDSTTPDVSKLAKWSSSAPAIASVDAEGSVTPLAAGAAEITATFEGQSAKAVISVTDDRPKSLVVTPIAPSIASGSTQAFVATATFGDGTTLVVTKLAKWTTSNAEVAPVDAEGKVTGMKGGVADISASYAGLTAKAIISVHKDTFIALEITPKAPTVPTGAKQTFKATATFSDGTTSNVTSVATWTSSSLEVATIDSGGVASALATGVTTITATFFELTATATFTVVACPDTITISVPLDLPIGATQRLRATRMRCDGTASDVTDLVTWSSSDETIATASSKGLVVAKTSGTVDVGASLDTLVAPKVKVTVKDASVTLTSIAVTPGTATLVGGTTRPYTALGTYSDASTADVTLSPLTNWAIVDALEVVVPSYTATVVTTAGVVNVNAKGGTSTYAGGRVVVRARQSGITGRSDLIIKDALGLAVTCTSPDGVASIAKLQCLPSGIGYPVVCKAIATLSDGATADVTTDATFTSSDDSVAKLVEVTSTGARLDVVGNGKSIVSASLGGVFSWKTGDPEPTAPAQHAVITAGTRSVTGLSITVAKAMTVGGTQQARALATFGAATACPSTGGPELTGVSFDVTPLASWSSSAPTIATVSSVTDTHGRIAAVAEGKTMLGVTFAGLDTFIELTVALP